MSNSTVNILCMSSGAHWHAFLLVIYTVGELLDHIEWVFTFIQKNPTVFQSDCTYLHSQHENVRILVTPHPC